MSFRGDERAQAIQIGAILLFAVLIILFATYQAFVVPDQNRQVEANHLDQSTADVAQLRNAIVSAPWGTTEKSVTIQLGTDYPPRLVALNPPSPTGAIRSLGTKSGAVNVTVANVVATDAEVDDYWTGRTRTFNSGSLSYQPNYNEFRNAPTVIYDNTRLFHRFRDTNLTRAAPTLIEGGSISLIALNGSIDVTESGSFSVPLEAVSASTRQIGVTNEPGQNVTLRFASLLGASQWRETLQGDGEFVDQGGHVVSVSDESIPGSQFTEITVVLEQGETYALQLTKIGVGTRIADEPRTYITELGPDARAVTESATSSVVFEVRDALNNPVSGVTVYASLEDASQNGSLDQTSVTTGPDGQATFEYTATDVDGPSPTFRLDTSFVGPPGSSYAPGAPENASVNITVQNTDGSGNGGQTGPYQLFWSDVSGAGVTCDSANQPERCTLDASQNSQIDVSVASSPTAENAQVSYALNNSNVGTLGSYSATLDSNGEDMRQFTAASNGTIALFATSGASGDTLVIEVINFGTGSGNNPPVVNSLGISDESNPGQGPRFDVSWSVSDPDGDLSQVEVTLILDSIFEFTQETETVAVSGTSESGTTRVQDSDGDCGDDYIIEVTVTDSQGNSDTESRSVTASC